MRANSKMPASRQTSAPKGRSFRLLQTRTVQRYGAPQYPIATEPAPIEPPDRLVLTRVPTIRLTPSLPRARAGSGRYPGEIC